MKNGDVRDFSAEMKRWNDLKYGYRGGWKNIQKIKLYCDKKYASKNNGHYNGNRNNHNNGNYNNRNSNNNNRNNYSNRNNNLRNNYGNNDNQNQYENQNLDDKKNHNAKDKYAGKAWNKYYGKGNVIFTSDYHYDGQYKARASGSHDYRSLRFYPKAILVAKSGRYVIVEYRDQHNRRQSFKLKEDVPDLKKYMASNLKLGSDHMDEPYKAITKFTIMRY